jgi:hypothetical protein
VPYSPSGSRDSDSQSQTSQYSDSSRSSTKFCVCKVPLTNTQRGDISCDLCRARFHSQCVGLSPSQPYTCEPCRVKHNSARSSCTCNSSNEVNQEHWISCDVCQTWYHQNCVGVNGDTAQEYAFVCRKCHDSDLNILNQRLSIYQYDLLQNIFSKLRNSKYAWPLFSNNLNIPITMNRITNKIRVRGYQSFKEFMDEMVEMFVKFRNYFQNHTQCHSKEYKCCEIVEYDFSISVRDFISKNQDYQIRSNPVQYTQQQYV